MGVGQRINYSNGHGGDAPETNVIFSYIDGYVWMSWPGYEGRVRVGPCEATTAAMREFLAQCELGERLANWNARSPSAPSSS
jgi:hypothetical protein